MDDVNVLDLAPYIKTNFSDVDDFFDIEFTYDKDIEIKKALFGIYEEVKSASDASFDILSNKCYGNFIQEVGNYIDEVLVESNANPLFPEFNSYLVQGASLILGMHPSDHLTIIDMLEAYILKSKKSIKIFRIKPEIKRGNQLTNIQSKIRESQKSLVIIERTESMPIPLLTKFIDLLHTILMEDQTKRITVFFCMSSNHKPLNQLLPISSGTRIHSNKLIVADSEDISRGLDQFLINVELGQFSIACNLVEMISDNFNNRDPTLANLKYIYQNCMFHHYRKPYNVANLNKKDLCKLIKSHPSLIRTIKNLDSVKNNQTTIDWTSATTVANFCQDQLACNRDHVKFVKQQIFYYFYLLQDETGHSFPSYLNDLYFELMSHDDLACSIKFVDAIQKLKKIEASRLITRIDKALTTVKKIVTNHKNNIETIFTKFKAKLENNEDCKQVVLEFINSIIEHSKLLKNPLHLTLSEVIYCGDRSSIKQKVFPIARYDAFKGSKAPKTYFDAIYASVLKSNEDIYEADLYDEFIRFINEKKNDMEEFISKKAKELEAMTPNKRARRSVHFEKINKSLESVVNPDEGLLKAIFIDTLENMEQQGLIKRNNVNSKKGTIKRRVWP